MQPPAFWHRPPGLWSTLLGPLGVLYSMGTAHRLRKGRPTKLDIPVICVGNINAGGTGKTPTVISLVQILEARGIHPHIVSRGYRGSLEGPIRVNERSHSAEDVGDEPLLLAAFADVWVSKDRLKGAMAAFDAGAEIVILDDGFQNPSLTYDLSIVVVDAARGFGNGKVMPAGPLREPIATGLKRADILLSIGAGPAQTAFATKSDHLVQIPHMTGQLTPLQTGMDWEGLRAFAFAGIGHPGKFFATLKALGAELVKTESLDDHQPLTPALMARLQAEAGALGAQLVTTEKDAVRLPDAFRREVLPVPVRLEIEDTSALDRALDQLTMQRR
ncbi:MAG: tetraacyldisaccharide 4'-kinase [Litoreibacter sp.]